LFFILRSFNTFCILLFSTQHSPSGPPLAMVIAPLFHPNDCSCQIPIQIRSEVTSHYTFVCYHTHQHNVC
jgi:hypothetical protein